MTRFAVTFAFAGEFGVLARNIFGDVSGSNPELQSILADVYECKWDHDADVLAADPLTIKKARNQLPPEFTLRLCRC
jgi:hypothetical protein